MELLKKTAFPSPFSIPRHVGNTSFGKGLRRVDNLFAPPKRCLLVQAAWLEAIATSGSLQEPEQSQKVLGDIRPRRQPS